MSEYKPDSKHRQEAPRPSVELSALIESVIDGKRKALDFSFTVPVTAIEHHCVWCGGRVGPCTLASGREYDAEVFVDDQGDIRVDLAKPHSCSELVRHEELLRASEKSEEWGN